MIKVKMIELSRQESDSEFPGKWLSLTLKPGA